MSDFSAMYGLSGKMVRIAAVDERRQVVIIEFTDGTRLTLKPEGAALHLEIRNPDKETP